MKGFFLKRTESIHSSYDRNLSQKWLIMGWYYPWIVSSQRKCVPVLKEIDILSNKLIKPASAQRLGSGNQKDYLNLHNSYWKPASYAWKGGIGIWKLLTPGNKNWTRNSLAVQWLGLRASTAGGMGSIPGWGTKNPQAVRCGQKKKKKGTNFQ